MERYLVTFDLHGSESPPGDLYSSIYHDIETTFGAEYFCKDLLQFCIVRSDNSVASVRNKVKSIIDRKANRYRSMDLVVFSVGEDIAISRGGERDDALGDFRRFFKEGI